MVARTVTAAMFRPPRLNFAQVCGWCATPFCESAACVAKHAASWWAPCPECVGGADDEFGCSCLNGVRQAASKAQAEQGVYDYLRELGLLAQRVSAGVRRAA